MIRPVYILLITALAVSGDHWTYKHIEQWDPKCQSGQMQSPIDLVESIATDAHYAPIEFFNYNMEYPATITNNGHTVLLKLEGSSRKPFLKGGNLPGQYEFGQMHFHWDSEHTINGKRYPLELHLVHYDTQYGSIGEAAKKMDGLVVLGVFFYLSPDDYDNLLPITEVFNTAATGVGLRQNTIINLSHNITLRDFLSYDTAGYYRYSGSLTTPGCNEAVTWIVFTNPIPISKKQEDNFRKMHTDDGILSQNYRPLQKLNSRKLMLKRSPINEGNAMKISSVLLLISLAVLKMF